jgi:hypothetical protein
MNDEIMPSQLIKILDRNLIIISQPGEIADPISSNCILTTSHQFLANYPPSHSIASSPYSGGKTSRHSCDF